MIDPPPPPRRIDLGGCTLTLLDGGRLRLDGGAMFGIIPRALWARRAAPDELNRIQLACNCLLVEWPGLARRAIIETGHGPKYAAKEQAIFAIDPAQWLMQGLAAAGVERDTITDVVLSHLHFDHAGGLTLNRETKDGGPAATSSAADQQPIIRAAPTFPKACVHVQRREFDDARANFGIMTMTYREENYAPIDAAGAWRLLDGPGEIIPGIRSILTPGHTRGHHSLLIEGRDAAALFVGDVMPTCNHLGPPYNMAYDVLPLDNRESKRQLLAAAADHRWLLVLDHEPQTPLVRAMREGEWFMLTPESQ